MAKKKSSKAKEPSFEESLKTLETSVARLEGGKLGLDESLEQYELGVKHLKSCYSLLTAAEQRIELVRSVDASGNPQSVPFDQTDSESLEQKGAARSRRRTAPEKSQSGRPKSSPKVDDSSSLF